MKHLLILLIGFTVISCQQSPDEPVLGEPQFRKDGVLDFLRPDGSVIVSIDIEVVADRESQARGLMGRTSLPARGGMLFTYDSPKDQSFWMKNTPLPLDINIYLLLLTHRRLTHSVILLQITLD